NILERLADERGNIYYRFHHHGAVEALTSLFERDQLQSITTTVALALERDTNNATSLARAAKLYAQIDDHRVAAQCAYRAANLAGHEGNLEASAQYYNLALAEAQLADMRFGPDFLAHIEIGVARGRLADGAIGAA